MAKKAKDSIVTEVEQVVDTVDKTVTTAVRHTDKLIDPVRRSAFRRFPSLFILLVTFGVSATIYGFEVLIAQWTYMYERPWLILLLGISILVGTGTLYKKLG